MNNAAEVKAFWHEFLIEQDIRHQDVREAGDELIESDWQYWSDRSMWDLLDRQRCDWARRDGEL